MFHTVTNIEQRKNRTVIRTKEDTYKSSNLGDQDGTKTDIEDG